MFSVAGRNYSRWVTRLQECRSNPTIKMILWKRFLKSYSVMLPIYFSKWRDAILFLLYFTTTSLHLRHNERDGVSNHQPQDCLLNCLFRRRSKKTSKLRVTDLCAGNSPVTGEFRAQMTSNAENASIFFTSPWLRPEQSGYYCASEILNWIFLNENCCILLSEKIVPRSQLIINLGLVR